MQNMCYYEMLEVTKDADSRTIKKAYRKVAMKFHPDQNQGDAQAEENFKLVNEAYQVLSDSEKRNIYDTYGKDGLENRGMGHSDMDMGDLSSIFESIFGSGGFGGRGQSRRERVNYALDIEESLTIEFYEAVYGVKKEIKYKFKKPCSGCNGKGGDKSTCGDCNGQGQVHFRQGFMTFAQDCGRCKGSGEIVKNKCKKCNGKTYEIHEEALKLDIPEGIDDSNRIRATNKGNLHPSGHRGDLYVSVRVKNDEHFQRDGVNLYVEVPLFFTTAVLGGVVKVPTLNGEKELNIKPGTNNATEFVFRGEGVKDVHYNQKGDLIAITKLTFPKKVNEEQKELLLKLEESFGYEATPHNNKFEGVLDRIKNWFS